MTARMLIVCVFVAACAARPVTRGPETPQAAATNEDRELSRACDRFDDDVLPECVFDDTRDPPSLRMDEALTSYSQEKYVQAIVIFDEVIAGKTDDDGCTVQKARLYRGKAYYRLGRYRQAFDDLVPFFQEGWHEEYYWSAAMWMRALGEYLPKASIDRCLAKLPPACHP